MINISYVSSICTVNLCFKLNPKINLSLNLFLTLVKAFKVEIAISLLHLPTYFITQVETSWCFSLQLRGKLHPKIPSHRHNITNDESCQWDKEVFIYKNNSAVPLPGKDCSLEYICMHIALSSIKHIYYLPHTFDPFTSVWRQYS